MKNTLMFLLASLLLAFNLTACGSDGQQAGANGSGAAGQTDGITGDAGAYNGTGSAVNGNGADDDGDATYRINRDNGGFVPDSSVVDDTRNVLDDAGDAVERAANGF